MKKILLQITILGIAFIFTQCSKKTHPEESKSRSVYGNETSADGTTDAKPVVAPKKIKTAVPKVIAVNDNTAKKTFDGRLYYDLEGRRYWKNYKDGKYYLYNKSMSTNPDFKKPG